MPALGWLLNLDMAGSVTSAAAAKFPGDAAWVKAGPGDATITREQSEVGDAAWVKAGPGDATWVRRES